MPPTSKQTFDFLPTLHPETQWSSLQENPENTHKTWQNNVRPVCASYNCAQVLIQHVWQAFLCKQLCWFPGCAGKKNLDFITSLAVFGISNTSSCDRNQLFNHVNHWHIKTCQGKHISYIWHTCWHKVTCKLSCLSM